MALQAWIDEPERTEPQGWIRALDGTCRRRKANANGWGQPETEWVAP